ncbi:hypothetical protein, partial [Bradyrhizobium retamae]|uniref:hypothetical protein n=1 Tax=Bradyrhizobium retamae TaxID=1300035 RepID=UPI001AECE54C
SPMPVLGASESQIKFARNPAPKPRFPANPLTAKRRFRIPNQRLGNSSRTTSSVWRVWRLHTGLSELVLRAGNLSINLIFYRPLAESGMMTIIVAPYSFMAGFQLFS